MSISLNDKIKAQDRRNLTFMRFSRERSMRVFKLYMMLAVPIGAVFYTAWFAFHKGVPPSGINTGYFIIDVLMELGSVVYITFMHMIFAYLYFGIPLLILSVWLSYRTYKKGQFGTFEAGFMATILAAAFLGIIVVLSSGSFVQAYSDLQRYWFEFVPVLFISVISAVVCRWLVWVFDTNAA